MQERKSDLVMARKSASPFYGLNNMLAVDEEEDEGGWGVVREGDKKKRPVFVVFDYEGGGASGGNEGAKR